MREERVVLEDGVDVAVVRRQVTDVAPTEPETVLNLAYPDTVTLSVAAPPAEWAQPTGTASVSSDSYFDGLGNGTDGRVYTGMSWDPSAGPIPYVFGR